MYRLHLVRIRLILYILQFLQNKHQKLLEVLSDKQQNIEYYQQRLTEERVRLSTSAIKLISIIIFSCHSVFRINL